MLSIFWHDKSLLNHLFHLLQEWIKKALLLVQILNWEIEERNRLRMQRRTRFVRPDTYYSTAIAGEHMQANTRFAPTYGKVCHIQLLDTPTKH